jgi:hypothetical protein
MIAMPKTSFIALSCISSAAKPRRLGKTTPDAEKMKMKSWKGIAEKITATGVAGLTFV